MDKPLKYFLGVSAVFVFLIGIFALATFTKKPSIPQEYLVIEEDDTKMIEAKEAAKITMDTFFAIYSLHPDSSFVRFSFEPTRDHIEHLWGKVAALDSSRVKIQLKRKEGLEDIYYPEELDLKVDRIEDWMVNLKNGKIRGGYTVQAMLMSEMEKPRANIDSLKLRLEEFSDSLK